MNVFKQYRRTGLSEMRPYVPGEDLTGISISDPDKELLVLDGGMIARNPKNHADQRYVSKKYFEDNLEEVISDEISKETTFKERLEIEKMELDTKLSKLSPFIESESFLKIDPKQQELLQTQKVQMEQYSDTLKQRLELL